MNVAQIPFVPCFMQVTKAIPALPPQDAGAIPANTPWGPPMGAAEFDHKNPQPINIDIHIWSWFDGLVKVKDGTSGMPIDSLAVWGLPGTTFVESPAKATTPIETKVTIPQKSLEAHYQMFAGPRFLSDMTPVFVAAYNKGTLLCSGWIAIVIK